MVVSLYLFFIGALDKYRLLRITSQQTQYILQHLYNVGPTSSTLVQHCINVIKMFCVCWAGPDWPVTPGHKKNCQMVNEIEKVEIIGIKLCKHILEDDIT